MLATTLGDRARELMDLFERNPYAAFLSLTVLAIIALFVLYVREQRAHLRTAQSIIPIAEALKTVVERNTTVLGDNTEVLQDSVGVLQRAVLVAEIAGERPPRAIRRTRTQTPVATRGDPNDEAKRAEGDPPAGQRGGGQSSGDPGA